MNDKSIRFTPDALSRERISACLDRPMKVMTYSVIDSTNSEAKRLIADGLSEPALLIAEEQTAGRGRLGRSFYSPSATGLYMSILLHPNAPAAEWLAITSAAAVAVCLAIESLTTTSSTAMPSIKWVNDVYLGDRKVCGILTEAVTDMTSGLMKSVVIGIGVNLSTAAFPDELADRAASLYPDTLPPFSRNELAAAIANRLCTLAESLSSGCWLPLYRERSYLDGKPIRYIENGMWRDAVAIGIAENGGLIVEEAGAHRTLSSGEVTVRVKE